MQTLIVAPHAGAWIEISSQLVPAMCFAVSHPTRVRGLKWDYIGYLYDDRHVAPHAGAWIEIACRPILPICRMVAPHAGAWIEIVKKLLHIGLLNGRTPRGCVD